MQHNPWEAVLIGFAAGSLVAIGGATKDAPYEGFHPGTFIRSPIIGAIEAPILAAVFNYPDAWLLFLATIATERATVEGWKIIRQKTPGKFEVGEWGYPKPVLVSANQPQSYPMMLNGSPIAA